MDLNSILNENASNVTIEAQSLFVKKGFSINMKEKPVPQIKTASTSVQMDSADLEACKTARQQLNAGMKPSHVRNFIATKYPLNTVKAEKTIARDSHIIGTVLIDCSLIAQKDFSKLASKSMSQFAVNCKCAKKVTYATECEVDDFDSSILSPKSANVVSKAIPVCSKTNLPILSSASDYSFEDFSKLARDLYASGAVKAKQIRASICPKEPLKSAKRLLSIVISEEKVEDMTNDSEFKDQIMENIVDEETVEENVVGLVEKPALNEIDLSLTEMLDKQRVSFNIDNQSIRIGMEEQTALPEEFGLKPDTTVDFKIKEEVKAFNINPHGGMNLE